VQRAFPLHIQRAISCEKLYEFHLFRQMFGQFNFYLYKQLFEQVESKQPLTCETLFESYSEVDLPWPWG